MQSQSKRQDNEGPLGFILGELFQMPAKSAEEQEARDYVQSMRETMHVDRGTFEQRILVFDTERMWARLGYGSLGACARYELNGISVSHVYRILRDARARWVYAPTPFTGDSSGCQDGEI